MTSGIRPGAMVVVDGADKLRDGIKITLRGPEDSNAPAAAPTNSGQRNRPRRSQ